MRRRVRANAVCIAIALGNPAALAEAPSADMSFLEFLGSAIERDGVLLDPLTLHEDETSTEDMPANPSSQDAAETEDEMTQSRSEAPVETEQ